MIATVVVPTRDRPEHLRACLDALASVPATEIIVVDDGSADAAAVAAVVAGREGVRLLRAGGHGPAAARNLGAAAASADVVCFTDDDCRPRAGWVCSLVRAIEGGAVAAAGPTRNGRPHDRFAAASQTITNHLLEASFDERSSTVGFAPTCNLAMTADLSRQLPFDESYPLAAGEDREWCDRLSAAGHDLVLVPDALVDHHQVLGWRGFWRQQVRYGRGARHRRAGGGDGLAAPSFYVDLLAKGIGQGPAVGALVVAAQMATATGIVQESLSARAAARRPSR